MPRKTRTWIVMADSACARIVAYDGPSDTFHAVDGAFFENPSAHLHIRDMGTDKPARSIESLGGARHAIEPRVDWRREDRIAFAKQIIAYLEKAERAKKFDRIVLAAPPTMLGHLRTALENTKIQCTVKSVRKDLMKVPAAKLAAQLNKAVTA